MIDGREVPLFVRRLFFLLFLTDVMACSILTPWMGWMMRIRFLEAELTLGLWEWTSILVWGSWGPAALYLAITMARRAWHRQ